MDPVFATAARPCFNAPMSATPPPASPLAELVDYLRQVQTLESIGSLLAWDQETYMPPRGAELRARQMAFVAVRQHEMFTAPQLGELLDRVPLPAEADADAAVIVRETRRAYDRARKLPPELVEELSRVTVLAQQAWVEARGKSDFGLFARWLERIVTLKQAEAQCVGWRGCMYDALLDVFEPDETTANLQRVFAGLRGPLVELVGRISASGRRPPVEVLRRRFPVEMQRKLGLEVAGRFGFDFTAGRLDVSAHPFNTALGPGDCRMTTRFDENDFGECFFSILHETGHGLYEQGLPAEHWGTPLGTSVSLGIHESQSRLWENLVGRSEPFWRWCLPRVREAFGDVLADVSADDWLAAINHVQPGFIRTEADEATYNLHIMLRFDLEQALLSGDLPAADLPAAWNAKMKEYLGLTPPNDAQGCLQDVHWSHGALGYFPTYTLGNLYAAQFFEQAGRDIGGLEEALAAGDFAPLLGWLRQHIHRHGKRYSAGQLAQRITGRPLEAGPLLARLAANARVVYGV
jgi:carboxypeptidase Taq